MPLLLLRSYRRSGLRLLLWSGGCFLRLALNNALVFVDLVLVRDVDLFLWRNPDRRHRDEPPVVRAGLGFRSMNLFLLGFVAMACFVAGLLFLRFWRETKDRLFLAFAVSFFVEGVNRTVLALSLAPQEGAPFSCLLPSLRS